MSKAKFEIALKKGEVGERIVKGLLEEKGWVVYRPETPGPHHFDMLCTKDKRVAIAIDVGDSRFIAGGNAGAGRAFSAKLSL